MKRLLWLLPLLFVSVISAAPSIPPQGAAALSTFLKSATDRGDVPGVVVAVVNKDGVLYNEAFGARFPEIEWRITPGNSSPLTDGASAALIMSEEKANTLGLTPRARFHTFAVTGSDPLVMLDGVIPATHKALAKAPEFSARGLATASNIVADVVTCGDDGAAVADQAAAIVNMIMANISA